VDPVRDLETITEELRLKVNQISKQIFDCYISKLVKSFLCILIQ